MLQADTVGPPARKKLPAFVRLSLSWSTDRPTLADRIKPGPIPLDEAQPIATQIAEALGAAHDDGQVPLREKAQ